MASSSPVQLHRRACQKNSQKNKKRVSEAVREVTRGEVAGSFKKGKELGHLEIREGTRTPWEKREWKTRHRIRSH